jgi:GAF domain-containing protein
VALLSEDGKSNEILLLDSGGIPCLVDPKLPMPIRGFREVANQEGCPVFENDFSRSKWTKYLPDGHMDIENVLFAPLIIAGETLGLIGLANKPGGFDQKDVKLASAFADLCAIALRNSRMLKSLESITGPTS